MQIGNPAEDEFAFVRGEFGRPILNFVEILRGGAAEKTPKTRCNVGAGVLGFQIQHSFQQPVQKSNQL